MDLEIEGSVGEIYHRLAPEDGQGMAALRVAAALGKGRIERGPFDEAMEQTPDAPGIRYEPGSVAGVPGVWCRPAHALPGAVILYLHGGAYIAGTARAFRHLAGQVSSHAGAAAFVPDYRLAPEHHFPAAVDDARAVYRRLVDDGARAISIVGDSAGGGLALVLLSIAKFEASKGQLLAPTAGVAMSPWTDLALTGESLKTRADADPFLTRDALAAAAEYYLDGQDAHTPLASPLNGNLAGLPALQLHVGLDEILLDDARRYAGRARAMNVNVALHEWEGMPHVFPSNIGTLSASSEALVLMGAFLRAGFKETHHEQHRQQRNKLC